MNYITYPVNYVSIVGKHDLKRIYFTRPWKLVNGSRIVHDVVSMLQYPYDPTLVNIIYI